MTVSQLAVSSTGWGCSAARPRSRVARRPPNCRADAARQASATWRSPMARRALLRRRALQSFVYQGSDAFGLDNPPQPEGRQPRSRRRRRVVSPPQVQLAGAAQRVPPDPPAPEGRQPRSRRRRKAATPQRLQIAEAAQRVPPGSPAPEPGAIVRAGHAAELGLAVLAATPGRQGGPAAEVDRTSRTVFGRPSGRCRGLV